MTLTSRWRLVTSAETEAAARAAAASFIAGLLLEEAVAPVVAPYFRGGFQVEFRLAHAVGPEDAQAWILGRVERMTVDWSRADEPPELLRIWSHALNVPRLDALEVVLFADEAAEEADEAGCGAPDRPSRLTAAEDA